jgi:hypothetical protein
MNMGWLVIIIAITVFSPQVATAQGVLEIPQQNSFQGGVGNLSGWKCTAGKLLVSFDEGPPIPVLYGSLREDTRAVCGDADNGFILSWNWNLLGDGRHTVRVFDNDVLFATTTFSVVTPGTEFLTQARASITVSDFPRTGETTTLRWQESTQSFVMVSRSPVDVPNIAGKYQYTGTLAANTCAFAVNTSLQETFQITQQGGAVTATTTLAGGLLLSGQINPASQFVLFSDPLVTMLNDGCTQTLGAVVEGVAVENFVDITLEYTFLGPCPHTNCMAVFLGSWAKASAASTGDIRQAGNESSRVQRQGGAGDSMP